MTKSFRVVIEVYGLGGIRRRECLEQNQLLKIGMAEIDAMDNAKAPSIFFANKNESK